ncbi:OsmC family protein [Maribacter sp. 1_MG-2023]|uniref:OsmC family protein n=1 Tax=Maribacter sp. 1_MG-2023 TaxID=3062677 RepID=UPI0026E342F8|nr:OsmC family protein [Maribacter sp. 1_MG-2023]MDO6472100.1 OsmC family protein [Maribacter sp. 1_MG-2023]
MNYKINAISDFNNDGEIHIKESNIVFGSTSKTSESLPNPAELFLGSFASCMLKNVERFSLLMKFKYNHTTLEVKAERLDNPPRMDNILYNLNIYSNDTKLNIDLLQKNIEKHGTIYNTVKQICTINGTITRTIND